jgi:hypothetical protein
MADDLMGAIDQLKDMLSSEDGGKKLNEMINSLGGLFGGNTSENNGAASNFNNANSNSNSNSDQQGINLDFIMKAKGIFDKMNGQPDNKAILLSALRPYMREERRPKLDMIIKMSALTKLGSVMDDIKGIF